ncbi:MAG TPA: hypothetical protein VD816_11385 [Ohtaekwangia sp.]|nr:hypothetical protein [Ohtaekwangia sp.]
MIRAFFALLCANLLLSGCTQRMICPAYQSAFIYDRNELRKKFSYFQEDSTPKILTASKNKYLVAENVSYQQKIRNMQTVAMKPVYVTLPDSLDPNYEGDDGIVPGAELDLAARSVIDSTYIVDVPQDTVAAEEDSVYVISKDREVRVLKYNFPDSLMYDPVSGRYVAETPSYTVREVRFNVQQDNYMWYLRDYLVLPDVRLAHRNQGAEAGGKSAKGKKGKKGFFGFFKNIFNKKKKEEVSTDTTALPPPVDPNSDFDYVDEDEQLQQQQQGQPQPAPKKKGPFSFLKKDKSAEPATDETAAPKQKAPKKKKEKKVKAPKEVPPAEEEPQDDDEGF